MPSFSNGFWNNAFSHVYIEDAAHQYPLTKRILSQLHTDTVQIPISHYKDVFCRTGQDFGAQKKSPQLILAVRNHHYFYPGSELCDSYGHDHFFYASHIMNCLYDCEYCYLKGMYPSAHVVVFVNIENYLTAAEQLSSEPLSQTYLCVSYDTDLLAFENLTGFIARWGGFADAHPETTIEIRTKSGAYAALQQIPPRPNMILAWTLSPDIIINTYEHGTASLQTRLRCIRSAIDAGWRVRLCIDPILYIRGWEAVYGTLMDTLTAQIRWNEPESISVGTFRMAKDYFKRMTRLRVSSALLAYPFENRNGVMCYPQPLEEEMTELILSRWQKHRPLKGAKE